MFYNCIKCICTKQRNNAVLDEQFCYCFIRIFRWKKTVGSLFGKKFLNSPNTTIRATENRLIISNEIIQDGIVEMRIKVTFVMNKMNDAGTCYPCEFFIESPISFVSQTFSCYGGPYNDPKEYGTILGALYEYVKEFNQL